MKKILFAIILLLVVLHGAGAENSENILDSSTYLSKLKVKLKEFAGKEKCHGAQTFYVSKLIVGRDDNKKITRTIIIYWVDGDMIYYYYGETHISDCKSNNLRKDVYKTQKEIFGSSYLLTVKDEKETIRECKNGNKIVIVMPEKKK